MRSTRAPALLTALAVLVAAGAGLSLSRHSHRPPLPARVAVRDALRDHASATTLAKVHWDRASASDVDGAVERVTLFEGARVVGEFAVKRDGAVSDSVDFTSLGVPYGDWIAYEPGVLIGLAIVFVLAGAVAPLRRLRNLDVAAALSLTAPVVLLQHRYLAASVLAAVPGIAYLSARCAWRALGPDPRAPAPQTPLFDLLTRGWEPAHRASILRWLLVALALVFA